MSACVSDAHPPIRACTRGGSNSVGKSAGPLRIVPSLVPGVELEKASWRTHAGLNEFSVVHSVEYRVRLRSMRDVPDTDLTVVYELRASDGSPQLLPDAALYIEDTVALQPLTTLPQMHVKDAPRDIHFVRSHEGAFVGGDFSSTQSCPVAVRVLPHNLLALYLHAGASVSDAPEALVERLRAAGRTGNGPLRILDITQDTSDYAGLLGIVVENAADSTLSNVVAAIPASVEERKDTIEFLIASIAPHAVVSMTTSLPHSTHLLAPLSYGAASVQARAPADDAHGHLVSGMPRIGDVQIAGAGMIPAGRDAHLQAVVVTGRGERIGEYDDIPAQWTIAWTGREVRLDTSALARSQVSAAPSGRAAVLRAEGSARAHVTATIWGVSGSADVTFLDPPGIARPGPSFDRNGRRVLPDGTVEVQNVCVVHPDGRVDYASWLTGHIAEVRADSLNHSELAQKRRGALVHTISGCKR